MPDFITCERYSTHEKLLVNLSDVSAVYPAERGTAVIRLKSQMSYHVLESVDEIQRKILGTQSTQPPPPPPDEYYPGEKQSLPPIQANDKLELISARGGIVEIKAAESVEGESAPSYPKLSANSYNGGKIRVGGYSLPVVIDIDQLQGLDKPHALYREHSQSRILGSGSTTRNGYSLNTVGELTNENDDVTEVTRLSARNFPFESSVGVQPLGLMKVDKGQTVQVNGQTFEGPMLVARPSVLKEVSVVQHGADSSTSSRIAASYTGVSEMNFSAWLKAQGFDEAALTEGQVKLLKASYEAELEEAEQKGKPNSAAVEQVLAAARDKEKRFAAYGTIIAGAIERGMDSETAERLVKAAQSDNLSETDFELRVLRATRHTGGNYVPSRSTEVSAEVIEASLARAVGINDIEKAYKPDILEASEKQHRNGVTLVELLQIAARRNGFRDISHRNIRSLLEGAFAPVHAAASGPSSYDIGGILSNVMNKMIINAFMAVEQEWPKIAATATVNDLKKYSTYALTGDMTYELVGKQGELKHATLGEETYENQAKTYGRIFGFSEDDMINDDLGAFARIQRMLGRGGALALNKVVWTEFLRDAASFWTSGRNNRLTGAGSALSIAGLSAASTKLEKQTDAEGEPLGTTGAVLAVPTDLKITGQQLVSDTEIRQTGSTDATYMTRNPHAGKYQLCASAYLNNAKVSGGSAAAWWLLADPQDLPTIEVAFLYGQQTPRVEQARANFDTLGISMRGVHRFGASKQEYRASVYNAGS